MVYWFVAGIGAKRSAKGGGAHVFVRALVTTAVVLFMRSKVANVEPGSNATIASPAVRMFGVFLCAVGIAYAVWARRHIGKNWGIPMSMKEEPQVVRSGPYSRTRHPIYTGVLLALLGNSLALGSRWLVAMGVALLYFVYAAHKEEDSMLDALPKEYSDYQRQTKMIIPFVL
jgi:protein-S-isoprenylcysteine O-methyltransferase Ste14